jgi:hypothetical protein
LNKCGSYLEPLTEARSEKIRTDENDNDVRVAELLVNNILPRASRCNFAVVPYSDQALMLKNPQMRCQRGAMFPILVRIGYEDAFH